MKLPVLCVVVVLLLSALSLTAQTPGSSAVSAQVPPPLLSFSGVLTNRNGKPLTAITGATFSLYAEQEGGAPLWLETQNVQPDKTGHYTVQLGSTTSQGLPASLFASGQARWLGVQAQGEAEQPRIMLLSVPYALKAGDAETLGGKPPSAFMTASSNGASGNNVTANTITGGGTKDYVPLWLSKTKLGNSNLFQSTAGDLGIGTTAPAANLDVNGTSDIRNTLTLFPDGSAPTLSVSGTAFNVSNAGQVSFVSGQTFPGTATLGANTFSGNQTVNGNVSSTGVVTGNSFQIGGNLFGFGNYGNGNAFLGFAGNSTMTGTINTGVGVEALVNNTTGSYNTATGFGTLLFNTTGSNNTATGQSALSGNTTGNYNTATGYYALLSNNNNYNTATGYKALQANSADYNTATGAQALSFNTTGNFNTANGSLALNRNTTGALIPAVGEYALYDNTTGSCNDATGVQALYANTTGIGNTATGLNALYVNTTSSNSTATGITPSPPTPPAASRHGHRISSALQQHHGHLQHGQRLHRALEKHHRQLQHGRWPIGAHQQHHGIQQHGHRLTMRSPSTARAITTRPSAQMRSPPTVRAPISLASVTAATCSRRPVQCHSHRRRCGHRPEQHPGAGKQHR